MSIYPEKKDGQLTGRFRVELQHKDHGRYRQRHDTITAARADEQRVKDLWAAGEAVDDTPAPKAEVHTIASVVVEAQDKLWRDTKAPETSWAHVRTVAALLGPQTRLDDIDTDRIDEVIGALRKRAKADATINRYLSHFRTFLNWACKRKRMAKTAFDEIEWDWRKETQGRIRWITHEEEEAMRTFLANRQPAVWKLIKVALETGCRRDELLTVELDQINGTRLHLWKTKTDTPRTVPMSLETTQMLRELVETGTMPTRRGLRSWWQRLRAHMGLEDDAEFVFHTCRHTRATRLLDAGVNVLIIKEWMGHKRIETTLRYTHVKPQNLEDALLLVGDFEQRRLEKAQKSAVS